MMRKRFASHSALRKIYGIISKDSRLCRNDAFAQLHVNCNEFISLKKSMTDHPRIKGGPNFMMIQNDS